MNNSTIDPLISLAFSIQSNKGVYALMLGSGVSRAAGVPTGWEVVLDLMRKVARLEGEDCEPDPVEWYREKFGTDPDYAQLLDMIAKSPAERARLLKGYFEPSDEEKEQGLKVPTDAHKAIAELVSNGYFRVIITTNFDRLLEQALEAHGVTPTIIASPDAAEGAIPLTHSACSIIKVHGDYLDTRIKNTPEELAQFDPRTDELLDRVFDQFGLIVCGWSTEWDTALCSAMERCKSHRFTTYWASISEPGATAQQLITLRRAQRIAIRDGDTFFREVSEKVTALEEYQRPHPLSTVAAVNTVKRYLAEGRYRIRLHDLVREEAERVYATLSETSYPVQSVNVTPDEFQRRMARYEAALETLVAMMATGCYWGTAADAGLWVRVLERIGNPSGGGSGYNVWLNMRHYPALQLVYGSGLAAMAAGKYDNLAAVLTKPQYFSINGERPLSLELHPVQVIDPNTLNQLLDKKYYTPVSDHLFALLREPLREFLPSDREYEQAFDRFEYLFGLVCTDLAEKLGKPRRGPIGRFGWRNQYEPDRHVSKQISAEVSREKNQWPVLAAGLFDGSLERFNSVKERFDALIAKIPW